MFRSIAFVSLLAASPTWANCPAQPQPNFNVTKPGLVTDKQTSLTWMRCSLGADWENGKCENMPSRFEWKEAQKAIDNLNAKGGFGGYKDWRLPTAAELITLVNTQCFHPAVDSHTFMDTQPTVYWTGETDRTFPDAIKVVHFYHGGEYITSQTKTWYVRAVRK